MRIWAETKVYWRGFLFGFQPLTFSASYNKGSRWLFIVSCPAYFILQMKNAMITTVIILMFGPRVKVLNVHCCTKLNWATEIYCHMNRMWVFTKAKNDYWRGSVRGEGCKQLFKMNQRFLTHLKAFISVKNNF